MITEAKGKPQRPPTQPTQPALRVIKRRSIDPVPLQVGDHVTNETVPGNVLQTTDITDTQVMTANEAVLFESTFEGRRCIGGFILEAV